MYNQTNPYNNKCIQFVLIVITCDSIMNFIDHMNKIAPDVDVPHTMDEMLEERETLIKIISELHNSHESRIQSTYEQGMFSTVTPKISFIQYLWRCNKYLLPEVEVIVSTIILIDRYFMYRNASLNEFCGSDEGHNIITKHTIHKLFAVAFGVAQKDISDAFFSNKMTAEVFGVLPDIYMAMQMEFLKTIKFDLWISVELYEKYKKALIKFGISCIYSEVCDTAQ